MRTLFFLAVLILTQIGQAPAQAVKDVTVSCSGFDDAFAQCAADRANKRFIRTPGPIMLKFLRPVSQEAPIREIEVVFEVRDRRQLRRDFRLVFSSNDADKGWVLGQSVDGSLCATTRSMAPEAVLTSLAGAAYGPVDVTPCGELFNWFRGGE